MGPILINIYLAHLYVAIPGAGQPPAYGGLPIFLKITKCSIKINIQNVKTTHKIGWSNRDGGTASKPA